ncbi:hypothetical protein [Agrobacterium tumefaciens]|uniref:Uncharacterized protein n=1 Tax=Agrobacterium tumefaciens TaxID=358 RepID=A0AA44F8I5_AGRTU|nr:hypothetical protein [Agrobacterium tumefaciens]NSL25103.1 hypothetical protein [Agrobacterium tumefaciens]NTB86756.1 hypothetical protein [Agrobacterium tumefaciens]NTC21085.1 hypothetical protein [Agrobacterium tumefaciens]NTC30633.1 hypothetical protein [Agrobacterium tumefaciens]NTC57705.1 hypothetical protein [Agrobacterium tumefaciens]
MSASVWDVSIHISDISYAVRLVAFDGHDKYNIVIPEDIIVGKAGFTSWYPNNLTDYVKDNINLVESFINFYLSSYSNNIDRNGLKRGRLPNESTILVTRL